MPAGITTDVVGSLLGGHDDRGVEATKARRQYGSIDDAQPPVTVHLQFGVDDCLIVNAHRASPGRPILSL